MSNGFIGKFKKLGLSEIILNLIPALIGVIVLVTLVINLMTYGEPVLLSQAMMRSYSEFFGKWYRYLFTEFGYTSTHVMIGVFFISTSISCFFTSFANQKKTQKKLDMYK